MNYEEIHKRERKLVEELETSATTVRVAYSTLGLPEDVKGLTIVDLAAGACPLVAYLLERGADAYAADYLYERKAKLRDAINSSLRKVLQQVQREFPAYHDHMKKVTESAIAQFSSSFNQHRDRYIEAWLTNLPFPDNFADLTVSLNGISDLAEDFDVLKQATREAIRITKPEGTILLAPFLTKRGFGGANGAYTKAHNALVEYLSQEGAGQISIESNIPNYLNSRLRILKSI